MSTPRQNTMQQRVEELMALCFVLSARISVLETSNADLRAAAGLDPPPPTIGAELKTVKQVADDTKYSQSQVYKWIRNGKVDVIRVGGKVLIVAASVPEARTDKFVVRNS